MIRLGYGATQKREKPLSQAEFCRMTGIAPSAWNNAETGDNRIGLDLAQAVKRQTGASLDYIYEGDRSGLPHALAIEIEKLEKTQARRA